MLIVKKGPAEAARVSLGGGFAMVRPATSFESELARIRADDLVTGLRLGQDASERAAAILGEEFESSAFDEAAWCLAAGALLHLVELAAICVESLDDVRTLDGTTLTTDKAHLAALLRDSECVRRIRAVMMASIHEAQDEGKELPVSRNGASETADLPTAPVAKSTEARALPDGPTMASDAPRSSIDPEPSKAEPSWT